MHRGNYDSAIYIPFQLADRREVQVLTRGVVLTYYGKVALSNLVLSLKVSMVKGSKFSTSERDGVEA